MVLSAIFDPLRERRFAQNPRVGNIHNVRNSPQNSDSAPKTALNPQNIWKSSPPETKNSCYFFIFINNNFSHGGDGGTVICAGATDSTCSACGEPYTCGQVSSFGADNICEPTTFTTVTPNTKTGRRTWNLHLSSAYNFQESTIPSRCLDNIGAATIANGPKFLRAVNAKIPKIEN